MNQVDAKFCSNCGEPLDPAAKFCALCGTRRAEVRSKWSGVSSDVPPPPPESAPPSDPTWSHLPPPPSSPPASDLAHLPPPPSAVTAGEEQSPPPTSDFSHLPPPPSAVTAGEEQSSRPTSDLSDLPPPPSAVAAGEEQSSPRASDPADLPPLPPPPRPADVPPPRVIAPVVSLPPADGPSPNRKRAIATGAVVGVVIVAAAGLAYARPWHTDHKVSVAQVTTPTPAPLRATPTTTARGTPAPTTTARGTPAPTTTAAAADTRAVVSQIDASLNESHAQLAQLQKLIGQFNPAETGSAGPCELSAADAAAQTNAVIAGRRSMDTELARLSATSTGNASRLVTLLRTAIDLSLRSDYAYQAWMSANAGTDASVPCARIENKSWRAAQAIAARASDAKRAFLGAYHPVATGLGVRADWLYSDF